MIPNVLTIAGSDSSGGAGLQADLKTFQEYGVYGFNAITSIVTMDPQTNWSHHVTPIEPTLVEQQLTTIFAGKNIKALKTGMLGDIETIDLAADYIEKYTVEHVVIDPVMACKGTTELLQPENVVRLKEKLIPLATVATPNLLEAKFLADMDDITTLPEMKEAAKKIIALGAENVVIKGGKNFDENEAIDLFYDGENFVELRSPKIETNHNHGAGCTFAAATTAGLAKGLTPLEAVTLAKDFVTSAIQNGVTINPFVGHIWHGAFFHAEDRVQVED
ncbi:bifunctional hydroxymethylpyrimidine kinase/phosphomethylpyrimidine kinase [Vagococcus zengguangii]|uniref:bifunctional hydroxymethylpyrimidine kinase/phosphomethylpyrimidine kinase n=1 Tax=Vagococcus zengguangii TaxID=2571750 RepID=UPI001109680A|nr:bifunctional hydroxymethylpyrimidine kinase/phosphomethylpyrimidine kinase [Vagococcus zengguangii]TLG80269.1 bifunctional hydroxymethylpyrimidine kinase/phosphomethylpyrimidine kinase [Vagococcus zengguangii]